MVETISFIIQAVLLMGSTICIYQALKISEDGSTLARASFALIYGMWAVIPAITISMVVRFFIQ